MRSLHAKLTLSLAAVLAVVSAGLLLLSVRTSQLYEQEVQQELNHELAAHIVDEYSLIRAREIDEEALAELFHQLMVVNPAIEVYLLDPSGEILAYSAPEGRVVRERVALAPVHQFLEAGGAGLVLGDDPRDARRSKAFSAAPVLHAGGLEGYLYVVLGGEAYDGAAALLARSYILRLGAWIGAGILVLVLIAAALLFRRLTRPLSALDREMARFARARLDEPGPLRSEEGDEIARLERSFRGMAARIHAQMDDLARNDQLRRELVANVSHDLRTPLAHLNGYLETLLLREDRLSASAREEHLRAALRHGERLARLVDELFELARLDALEEPLRPEELSLIELANDLARRYRPEARRHGVELVVRVAESCEVYGDAHMISRTLENLLDNALRHTPAGGRVELEASRNADDVVVRVCDTGEGIPIEDQPRIFDRFYRRGTAESAEYGGGLGLAIAKRAVELHRGSIRLDSSPGLGSAFELALPTAISYRSTTSAASA